MDTNMRDWNYKMWLGGGIFNSNYEQGVNIFLDFVFLRPEMFGKLKILCPSNQCDT